MGVSLAVSLLLFPVLVELLPRGGARRDISWLVSLADGCRELVLHHRWPVLALSVALLAGGVTGALQLTVENSFINYFKSSTQVHQELAYIDQQFGGTTPLDLVYTLQERAENPDVVLAAGAVTQMQRIQQQLDEYEATGRILSPVNLTNLARQVNNDEPLTEYELTLLYWLMDEELRSDLIGSFYDESTEQVRFNVWIQDLTRGLDREQFLVNLREDLSTMGVEEEEYQLSNLFVLYQDIMQRLFDSQLQTLLIVYAAMAVVFLLIFLSPVLALVALVPNMLSTAMIFGIMGWARIPLDVMTITIAAIVMGIAVDDTIHYIHRYREERSEHSAAEAIRRTHGSVGMAVIYTTLIIAAGFSLLGFSDFVPSAIFGLLTAMAMLVALFADLCLLPVLLFIVDSRDKPLEQWTGSRLQCAGFQPQGCCQNE
jgi:predicted RND superfamily exporter protein